MIENNNTVSKGMCADWAIHDSENEKGQRNLHIHVLLTMGPITENGEWGAKQKKVYDLDENGERIPVIDKKTGQQKVDKRNRKQWKAEIQSLQAEYNNIGREQTKTATELAYAEVISYNRKNLERELQNESRQSNRQQSRTKRREEEI